MIVIISAKTWPPGALHGIRARRVMERRICRETCRTGVFRVTLDAMRVKGLVWLGIPADDYAAAVRFFGET